MPRKNQKHRKEARQQRAAERNLRPDPLTPAERMAHCGAKERAKIQNRKTEHMEVGNASTTV